MKRTIIYTILFLSSREMIAQEALRNSGNLQIHSGASLKVIGNFTNASTANLENNGNLYVAATITNDQSSMSVGTGTLYINGASAQTLNGTQPFQTHNLVSDNAAGINLTNNLHVSGLHSFTAGLITTSATPNYLVYEAGSSHSGTADNRHVIGWVKKKGNTDFSFPVGDGTYFRPAAIENLSAVSEFNARYYRPTTNVLNVTLPIRFVKANEYWQINRVSGGTASVGLNWNHPKIAMDNVVVADIVVAYYTAGNWTDIGGSAAGIVTTTGSISSNPSNAFGSFTLGYKTFPVPLKLISFTGERKPGVSTLSWTTEHEQLVDRFELQRSYDGSNFSRIASLPARNLASVQRYFYDDHSPLDGLVYYRLLSIDLDGRTSYSQVVVLTDKNYFTNSFIVPNPVSKGITVFNKIGQPGLVEYHLFNSGGQLILKGSFHVGANGGTVIPLPMTISRGIYFLELNKNNQLYRQKMLVE